MVITYDRWSSTARRRDRGQPAALNEKVNSAISSTASPHACKRRARAEDLEKMLVDNPGRILPMASLH
jgi:hypothetical protein